MKVPVSEPLIGTSEVTYVNQALESGWISSQGEFIEKFENSMAKLCDRKFAISCTNGTDALLLALRAIGIKKGDEVILPNFTIISCAQAIITLGAKPIFIDCHTDTFNMNTSLIEKLITKKTKAIMCVHIYGLPCDVLNIIKLAKKYKLLIIEDAAQAHGMIIHGRPAGSFGDVSTFSFYANKNISTGEGGMVLTNKKKLMTKIINYRNLCFSPKRRFVHYELGYNMRLSNIQAAIGLAQFERLDNTLKVKISNGLLYTELLSCLPQITLPLTSIDNNINNFWVYPIIIKKLSDKKKLISYLSSLKIETRPFFYPLSHQPALKHIKVDKNQYPNSLYISKRGIYLPSGATLTTKQIKYICNHIRKFFNEF